MTTPSQTPSRHLPSIDMVKGLAIIGVTLIHSEALGQTAWMRLLFFHSVPVFFVLFGLNAEQWFTKRGGPDTTATWYARSVKRILVPAWVTLLLWWPLALYFQPGHVRLSPALPFWHLIGYLRQVGAGWFITVVVQLVVLMPLFRWARERVGTWPLFVVGLISTIGTLVFVHHIRGAVGMANWVYLSPRFFAHVIFGMWLASQMPKLDWRWGAAALALFVPLTMVGEQWVLEQPWWRIANRVAEMPLTVLLLVGMGALASVAPVRESLGWLGRHSFGLYLGQIVVHNYFLFRWPAACNIFQGCKGGVYDLFDPWVYTAILGVGSAVFLALGNGLLVMNERLRQRGLPVPDLAT